MKTSSLSNILIILPFILGSCATHHTFQSFYSQNKSDTNIVINSPKWLPMLFISHEDRADVKKFTNGMKKIKVMINNDGHSRNFIESFDDFALKNEYVSYVMIRDNGDKMNIFIKEQKDHISEIVLQINSDNETIIIALMGKMLRSDLNGAILKTIDSD
ncbi:MAG: DUF4252 domain-containing protein [Saprospiraceae bacterium]